MNQREPGSKGKRIFAAHASKSAFCPKCGLETRGNGARTSHMRKHQRDEAGALREEEARAGTKSQ